MLVPRITGIFTLNYTAISKQIGALKARIRRFGRSARAFLTSKRDFAAASLNDEQLNAIQSR